MTLWTEAEFEEECAYIVNDHPWDSGVEGGHCGSGGASLTESAFQMCHKHQRGKPLVSC